VNPVNAVKNKTPCISPYWTHHTTVEQHGHAMFYVNPVIANEFYFDPAVPPQCYVADATKYKLFCFRHTRQIHVGHGVMCILYYCECSQLVNADRRQLSSECRHTPTKLVCVEKLKYCIHVLVDVDIYINILLKA